jgi:hypothetical protein
MIPGGLVDFVEWAQRWAFGESEITLYKDTPPGPEIRTIQESGHVEIMINGGCPISKFGCPIFATVS